MTAQEYLEQQEEYTNTALYHAREAMLATDVRARLAHNQAKLAAFREARLLAQEWTLDLMRRDKTHANES